MRTCYGCDYLIVENSNGVYQFWCTIKKEFIFRSLDDIKKIPAPEGCIYGKEVD